MPNFIVEWGALSVASMAVKGSGDEIVRARSALTHSSGALAGTLADGAYDALASAAVSTSAGFVEASNTLSAVLHTAADAYSAADASAEASFKHERG